MTATSVKEWPEPTMRTRRSSAAAEETAEATSPVLLGVAVRRGRAWWVSAQVCHNTSVMR